MTTSEVLIPLFIQLKSRFIPSTQMFCPDPGFHPKPFNPVNSSNQYRIRRQPTIQNLNQREYTSRQTLKKSFHPSETPLHTTMLRALLMNGEDISQSLWLLLYILYILCEVYCYGSKKRVEILKSFNSLSLA